MLLGKFSVCSKESNSKLLTLSCWIGARRCIFLSGCFHSVYFWNPSMFCVSILHSFLLPNSVLLCGHTTIHFSIFVSRGIWVVFSFSLLRIRLLWTYLYTSFWDIFLLGKFTGVEMSAFYPFLSSRQKHLEFYLDHRGEKQVVQLA